MIVHVGSTRPAKVEAVRAAIAAIATLAPTFRDAEVRAHELGTVGPPMPMTQPETIEGARLRASALVQQFDSGDGSLFVGLEGGLDPLLVGGSTRQALCSWACVTDGRQWSYGAGGVVLLPEPVAAAVLGGRELGDVVDGLAGRAIRGGRGAWGLLTGDLITRSEAFRTAVTAAAAPFYNPRVYA